MDVNSVNSNHHPKTSTTSTEWEGQKSLTSTESILQVPQNPKKDSGDITCIYMLDETLPQYPENNWYDMV